MQLEARFVTLSAVEGQYEKRIKAPRLRSV